VWSAPLLSRNVDYLNKTFAAAEWTESARQAALSVTDARKILRLGFPAWYKFKREPKKKQREALDSAYNMTEFGFLMDPGTGKTQTLIDWASCYAMEGRINAVLVVVPNSVTYNWIDELAIVCPIEYQAAVMDTGSYRRAERMIELRGAFKWLICSWESLSQGKAAKFCERFLTTSNAMLAVDESSWGKNHKATRAEVVTSLGLLAKYRGIATGTPVLSKLHDLFSQMEILNTQILGIGDFYAFRNRYVIMGGYEDKQVVGYTNVDELTELIRPYVFVARKRDCSDLPPRLPPEPATGILRRVKLRDEQMSLYKAVRSKFTVPEHAGLAVSVKNSLEVALRCRQIVQGIITVDTGEQDKNGDPITQQQYLVTWSENPKIRELLALLGEASEDEQCVIWTPFKLDVAAITAALQDTHGKESVLNLPHGDAELLQEETKKFRAGKYRFCVCTQQHGGIGLNLQSASIGIFMGNTENLEWRIQSEGRIERTGQQKPMMFYDIVAENTVDTKTIIPALRAKQDLAEFVKCQFEKGANIEDIL
jgi:SNF2 family DNA or RNA helicase